MNEVLVRRPVFPSDFRTLFRTIARCAVASSFGLAAASCSSASEQAMTLDASSGAGAGAGAGAGGAADGSTADGSTAGAGGTDASMQADAGRMLPGPWVPLECMGDLFPIAQTNTPDPLDSLVMYTPYYENHMPNGGPLQFSERLLHGESCGTATDHAACIEAVDRAVAETVCEEVPCTRFLIATVGDTVTRAEEHAALNMLLGGVDTEVEAAIVALLSGLSVMCWNVVEQDGEVLSARGTRMREIEGGYEVDTQFDCYGERIQSLASVDRDASAAILVEPGFCLGRRPEGLVAAAPCVAQAELGAYFAQNARLEAASVFAFEQLARDLERLDAPRELVELALRSALEEIGHVRTVGALAARFGGEPMTPDIAPPPPREGLAIALENAVEGCVRETYGALLAFYQAQAALDPHVRAAMTQIAEDETRHAELAWRIAAWLEPQLSERDQAAVQLARRAAYVALQSELASSMSRDARRLIGLPDEAVSRSLLAQLDSAIGIQA